MEHIVHAHKWQDALKMENGGYYGGRCEVFKMGPSDGPVYYLDYRLLYPSLCSEERLPCRLIDVISSPSLGDACKLLAENMGIATVDVDVSSPDLPLRRNGLIIWPIGAFTTILPHAELMHALERRWVRRFRTLSLYEGDMVLKKYAESLLAMIAQVESNPWPGGKEWLKRVAVSLSGKLGQRSALWKDEDGVIATMPYDEWYSVKPDGTVARYRSVGWHVQSEEKGCWGDEAVPSIACQVTSLARMKLALAVRAAGRDNVLYADTDSIWTTAQGLDNLNTNGLVSNDKPGMLRIKGTYDWIHVRGIKWYDLPGESVCAGFKVRPGTGAEDRIQSWERVPVISTLHANMPPAGSMRSQTKQRDTTYRHGRVMDDGKVIPIILSE